MKISPERPHKRSMVYAALSGVAALALSSACADTGNPGTFSVDKTIVEPQCTGVTVSGGLFNGYLLSPTLKGSFVDPTHVQTYLVDAPQPLPTHATAALTSGNNKLFQDGIGLYANYNALPDSRSRLVLFDFQHHDGWLPDGKQVPAGVPEINCPPMNVKQLIDLR